MENESINDRIRKFIIKNTVGRITFSADDNTFRIILRQSRSSDKAFFRNEISKYSEWHNAKPENIDKFVEDTRHNATLCNEKRTLPYPNLNLSTLKVGYIVNLFGKDDRLGKSEMNLMFLGRSQQSSNMRFLVLSSSQKAIHEEDILEPYGTELWSTDYPVSFIVYRHNRRIPDDGMLFQTYPIEHISVEAPSLVQEVIDARNDFSYDEYESRNADKLSYTRPSMALLLHEFSTQMPYYADFDENGVQGAVQSSTDNNTKKEQKVRVEGYSGKKADNIDIADEMEEILRYVKSHVPDDGRWNDESLRDLVTRFRENNITIMALEEMLKFYAVPHNNNADIIREAFITISNATKTSNDLLEQDIRELRIKNADLSTMLEKAQEKVQASNRMNKILAIIIACLLVIIILVLVL